MPFTLWSHNKLLGESDFEIAGNSGPRRLGTFRPSALGTTLLPTLTGFGPALLRLGESCRRQGLSLDDIEMDGPTGDAARDLYEQSGAVSFARQVLALQLELRDPHGRRIGTQCLNVHDLERTLDAARCADDDVPRERSREQPRYFLSATLSCGRRKAADLVAS